MDRQIVRVEIEYEDGEVRAAEGEDADYIWRFYAGSAEFYLAKQGRTYEGPCMRVVRASRPIDESADDARVRRTLRELADD